MKGDKTLHSAPEPASRPRRAWRRLGAVALTLLLAMVGLGVYHQYKPLPEGLNAMTPLRPAVDVQFLSDDTWQGDDGARHMQHAIFDEALRLIGQAQRLVVMDMFLFNDFAGAASADHRLLSRELTQALIDRRKAIPTLQAVVITDPLNTVYGSLMPDHLIALEEAGIRIVITELPRLRDSNPLWSAPWRLCCQWLGNDRGSGWLPNPFGEQPITLRSYLRLLNFKANHRKTLVVDEDETWTGLVTSANPHDASSAHSNVALRFSGTAVLDLLATERAVARMSGATLPKAPEPDASDAVDGAAIQLLTEAAIRDAALSLLDGSRPGDRVDIAMFYLSHRAIVDALTSAHERGVKIRVLLDPNRDAFGRTKKGVPNRQVGMELHRTGIPVRWCHTSGEQCHSKMLMHAGAAGEVELILGSANFTRRNLDNYNLETDVRLLASTRHPAIRQAQAFFERLWRNEPDGRSYSLPFDAFADDSRLRYWQYRIMEATGLSTF